MPIPFFGALFSSSSSKNMSYPVQKSDDEWQAVLTPGQLPLLPAHIENAN
jgi:peptide-methionine (R)-S-oxide reductase